jgi:hypothetical protein
LSRPDPRPTATDRVRLRVGEFETLARVTSADQDAIRLDMADAVIGTGEIVFSHPRGVIALAGTLAARPDGAVFTVTETKRLEQRRAAFRLAVACPVHVVRRTEQRLDYRTGDLSMTGVRILDADELVDDEHVVLEIELEDHGTVEVTGQVVRRDELSIGVRFCSVPAGIQDHIGRFIAAAQRRRLRRAA